MMCRLVATCDPAAPLALVARIMRRFDIHSVVMIERHPGGPRCGVPVGIASDLDVIRTVLGRGAAATAADASGPPVSVGADEPLERAATLMGEARTSHLMVVDPRSGRLVGGLSSLDFMRAIAGGSIGAAPLASPAADEESITARCSSAGRPGRMESCQADG